MTIARQGSGVTRGDSETGMTKGNDERDFPFGC